VSLYLIVSRGKLRGRVIPVEDNLFLIGADRVCQLRVKHRHVAGQHCALEQRSGKAFVRDLNSGRPTKVNGREVPPGGEWPVQPGDVLGVGPLQAVVQGRDAPLTGPEAEEWAAWILGKIEQGKGGKKPSKERGAAAAAAAMLRGLEEPSEEVRGRLQLTTEKGVTVAQLMAAELLEQGEIDLLRQEILEYHAVHRPARVLLDLGNVQRMSSLALSMLVILHRRLRAEGARLALCRIHPELQPIMNVMGVAKMVPCFPDRDAALAATW
jgi:anti-anti-sigma factor